MRSLRLRLVVLFLLSEAGIVLGLGAIGYHRASHAIVGALDAEIHARVETLSAALEERGPGEAVMAELSRDWLADFDEGEDRFFEVAHAAGPVVLASASLDGRVYGFSHEWLERAEVGTETSTFDLWRGDEIRLVRAVVSPTIPLGTRHSPDNEPEVYIVQVGERTDKMRDQQEDLVVYAAAICGGVLALSAILVFGAVTLGLRPLRRLAAEVGQIRAEELGRRLPETGLPSELRPLSRGFNETLGRLEAAFSRERQFLADASHELRTPVSVVLSTTEVTLRRERPAEEYVEAMESCRDAARRMQVTVESLMALAKAEHEGSRAPHEAIDLGPLVAEVAEFLQPLAGRHEVTLATQLPAEPVDVLGNRERLRELIVILASNAIVHNRRGGSARLVLAQAEGEITLRVEDSGPGIAPEHLPHLFERFYRVDKARSRERGGSGLGLAIAQQITQQHGGRVEVASRVGEGSVFTLTLPRA